MGPARLGSVAGVGALAVAAARLAGHVLRDHPPGGAERWTRTNHAGEAVTLLEGPAYVLGATVAALPSGPGAVLATVGAGAVGVADDLASDAAPKGFRGHLTALRHGRVTTGTVKILGLAATGMVATWLADRHRGAHDVGPVVDRSVASVANVLIGGAVVAGSANLVNLFDLRPGRALKVVLLAGAPLALTGPRSYAAAAACGAAVASLPADLAGRSMLGDTGANAAGALVGTALTQRLRPRDRLLALLVLAGLTAASEKVSFTKVIQETPVLREIDAIGRRRQMRSPEGRQTPMPPPEDRDS